MKQPLHGPRSPLRHPLVIPGALLLLALVALVLEATGVATGLLLGAVGVALYVFGKERRWKGAPEAGLLVIGFGVLLVLLAFLN